LSRLKTAKKLPEPNSKKIQKLTKPKKTLIRAFIREVRNKMSEESDDSDSSDSSDSSRQKMFTAAGMVLCVTQFAFFVGMILMFMEMDFAQGFKFMLLAYSSAFIYKNLENSGIIRFVTRN